MGASGKLSDRKRWFYVLVLGLICIGATVRVALVLLATSRENERAAQLARAAPASAPVKIELAPEYLTLDAPSPRMSDKYPYVSMTENSMAPNVGECETSWLSVTPVDRFEVDLRYGSFILRQTDLILNDDFRSTLYAKLQFFRLDSS